MPTTAQLLADEQRRRAASDQAKAQTPQPAPQAVAPAPAAAPGAVSLILGPNGEPLRRS